MLHEDRYHSRHLVFALDCIAGWLQKNSPERASGLAPGLSPQRIDEQLEGFPYRLPREIHDLYEWHNGMQPDCEGSFIWYHRFLSLDEAWKQYRNVLSHRDARWFPIFQSEGDFYFVQAGLDEHDTLPIFHVADDGDAAPVFCSLTSMMQTHARWLQTGSVIAEDDGSIMKGNINSLIAVYQEFNPGLKLPFVLKP